MQRESAEEQHSSMPTCALLSSIVSVVKVDKKWHFHATGVAVGPKNRVVNVTATRSGALAKHLQNGFIYHFSTTTDLDDLNRLCGIDKPEQYRMVDFQPDIIERTGRCMGAWTAHLLCKGMEAYGIPIFHIEIVLDKLVEIERAVSPPARTLTKCSSDGPKGKRREIDQ